MNDAPRPLPELHPSLPAYREAPPQAATLDTDYATSSAATAGYPGPELTDQRTLPAEQGVDQTSKAPENEPVDSTVTSRPEASGENIADGTNTTEVPTQQRVVGEHSGNLAVELADVDTKPAMTAGRAEGTFAVRQAASVQDGGGEQARPDDSEADPTEVGDQVTIAQELQPGPDATDTAHAGGGDHNDRGGGGDGNKPDGEFGDDSEERDPGVTLSLALSIAGRQIKETRLDDIETGSERSPGAEVIDNALLESHAIVLLKYLENPDASVDPQELAETTVTDDLVVKAYKTVSKAENPGSPVAALDDQTREMAKGTLTTAIAGMLGPLLDSGIFKEHLQDYQRLMPAAKVIARQQGFADDAVGEVFTRDDLYPKVVQEAYGSPVNFVAERMALRGEDSLKTIMTASLCGSILAGARAGGDKRSDGEILDPYKQSPRWEPLVSQGIEAMRAAQRIEIAGRVRRAWGEDVLANLPEDTKRTLGIKE